MLDLRSVLQTPGKNAVPLLLFGVVAAPHGLSLETADEKLQLSNFPCRKKVLLLCLLPSSLTSVLSGLELQRVWHLVAQGKQR